MTTECVDANAAEALLSPLVALLQDAVHGGASVGFLRPLADAVAAEYWRGVFADVAGGSRVLLVGRDGGAVVGSVQLGLCTRQNGLHRAEVQKLFVHTSRRGHGLAGQLMAAVEREARARGRTLLYLDTEPGKPAERLYQRLGWARTGEIPDYARDPDGRPHATAIFYRVLAS